MDSEEKVYERIALERTTYGDFINRFPWEWFVTLHFCTPVQETYAFQCLREWNIKVCITEKLQTAYIAILTYKSHIPHFHVLMFGRNRYGKTLKDVPRNEWEREWLERLGIKNERLVQISLVECKSSVSFYVSHARNMMLSNPDRYELVTYNQKLLRKWDSQNQIISQ